MENREVAFWRAVVARAWADASSDNETRDREEAREWLLGFSSDFRVVCHLADIDPEGLLDRARKMAEQSWPSPRKAA